MRYAQELREHATGVSQAILLRSSQFIFSEPAACIPAVTQVDALASNSEHNAGQTLAACVLLYFAPGEDRLATSLAPRIQSRITSACVLGMRSSRGSLSKRAIHSSNLWPADPSAQGIPRARGARGSIGPGDLSSSGSPQARGTHPKNRAIVSRIQSRITSACVLGMLCSQQ